MQSEPIWSLHIIQSSGMYWSLSSKVKGTVSILDESSSDFSQIGGLPSSLFPPVSMSLKLPCRFELSADSPSKSEASPVSILDE